MGDAAHLDDATLTAAIQLVLTLREQGYDRRATVPRLRELLVTGRIPAPTSRGHRTSVPYAGADPSLSPQGTARGAYPPRLAVGHPDGGGRQRDRNMGTPETVRRRGSLPARILELLRAHREGLTAREIAEALGVDRDLVVAKARLMPYEVLTTGEGPGRRYLLARRRS